MKDDAPQEDNTRGHPKTTPKDKTTIYMAIQDKLHKIITQLHQMVPPESEQVATADSQTYRVVKPCMLWTGWLV